MSLVSLWTDTPWHDVVAAARGEGSGARRLRRQAKSAKPSESDDENDAWGTRARVARGRTDEQDRRCERTPSGRERSHRRRRKHERVALARAPRCDSMARIGHAASL